MPKIISEIEGAATSKYVIWGAVGIAGAIAAYFLYTGAVANAANASGSSATAATGADTTSTTPIVYSSNGQVDTSQLSTGSGTDYTSALVALETQQAGYNYSAQIAGINSQTLLGLVGNQTSQMAIGATDYQTSAQILNTTSDLFKAGFNALTGTITSPNGTTTGINIAGSISGGKGSANQILTNYTNSSAYAAFTPSTSSAAGGANGATNATNQLVAASLATLVHNGGLGLTGTTS